jgi:hypothetical protein
MTYRFDSHIFASYYFNTAYRLKTNQWFKTFLSDYQANEEKIVLDENFNLTQKRGTAAALISNVDKSKLNIRFYSIKIYLFI